MIIHDVNTDYTVGDIVTFKQFITADADESKLLTGIIKQINVEISEHHVDYTYEIIPENKSCPIDVYEVEIVEKVGEGDLDCFGEAPSMSNPEVKPLKLETILIPTLHQSPSRNGILYSNIEMLKDKNFPKIKFQEMSPKLETIQIPQSEKFPKIKLPEMSDMSIDTILDIVDNLPKEPSNSKYSIDTYDSIPHLSAEQVEEINRLNNWAVTDFPGHGWEEQTQLVANEVEAVYISESDALADRKLFVENLGKLLSQTREGIYSLELTDDDIVIVHYKHGNATKEINVNMDSYMAIVYDVVKNLT